MNFRKLQCKSRTHVLTCVWAIWTGAWVLDLVLCALQSDGAWLCLQRRGMHPHAEWVTEPRGSCQFVWVGNTLEFVIQQRACKNLWPAVLSLGVPGALNPGWSSCVYQLQVDLAGREDGRAGAGAQGAQGGVFLLPVSWQYRVNVLIAPSPSLNILPSPLLWLDLLNLRAPWPHHKMYRRLSWAWYPGVRGEWASGIFREQENTLGISGLVTQGLDCLLRDDSRSIINTGFFFSVEKGHFSFKWKLLQMKCVILKAEK